MVEIHYYLLDLRGRMEFYEDDSTLTTELCGGKEIYVYTNY